MKKNDPMPKQQNKKEAKRVHNLIIVDESGSMYVIRKQALVGMNGQAGLLYSAAGLA